MSNSPDNPLGIWEDVKKYLRDLWSDPRKPQVSKDIINGRPDRPRDSWPESQWNKSPDSWGNRQVEPKKPDRPRAETHPREPSRDRPLPSRRTPGPDKARGDIEDPPTVAQEMAIRLDKVAGMGQNKSSKPEEGEALSRESDSMGRRPEEVKEKVAEMGAEDSKKAAEQLLARSKASSANKWSAKTKTCPKCGKEILAVSTVCPFCGTQEKTGLMGVAGLIIVLFLVLFAVIAGLVYMMDDSGSGEKVGLAKPDQEQTRPRTASSPAPKTPAPTTLPAQPEPKEKARPQEPARTETAAVPESESEQTGMGSPGRQDRSAVNKWGMKFVLIPKGDFRMGKATLGTLYPKPGRLVWLTKPFYIQATEVSRGQWLKIMGPSVNIDDSPETRDLAVDYVSWEDTQKFIKRLNKLDPEYVYRLPTEAEWEYACRAGTEDRYFYDIAAKTPNAYSWNSTNTWEVRPVGTKEPNAWGLHDTYGNVWEWCADWYDFHGGVETTTDPQGPARGEEKVYRGGAYFTHHKHLDSLISGRANPEEQWLTIGFRLVMEKP